MSLLRIFYTSIDEKLEEIDTSFKENDINNYTIKVHALKSSARIVGANDLGEDAQLLENAGKEGNIDFIKDNHECFLSKYRKFKDILKEVFDDDKDDKQKPEADPDLLDEVYKELKLAAEDMDCDKLSAIFEEMEDYSIPESEKEKWNRLKTASDNYDYDEISGIIESAN
jgi:HPt (histidine-containing phosphotransfer) domain-containing protein